MKRALRNIYESVPFKKALFTGLRRLPIPERVYKHLHFKGVIEVKVSGTERFRMRHHGYVIENELFWRGMQGWEKISLELWVRLCRRSSVIFDIGANTGVYSLIANAVNKKATIIAVEPVARVFVKLEDNLQLNNAQVKTLMVAVSDHEGMATLYEETQKEHVLSTSLDPNYLRNIDGIQRIQVPVRTVAVIAQEMRIERVDLLKIDVEAHEPAVLEGFTDILIRDRPTLLIEVLTEEVAERLERILAGLGYLYYNIDEISWPPQRVEVLHRSAHYNFLICQPEVARAIGIEG